MSEADDNDQWPESLRIMREQRERIDALENKLADARHWSERHNTAAIRLGDTVCEQREQIAALEAEVERICADAERGVWILHNAGLLDLWAKEWRPSGGVTLIDFLKRRIDETIQKDNAARAAGGEHG